LWLDSSILSLMMLDIFKRGASSATCTIYCPSGTSTDGQLAASCQSIGPFDHLQICDNRRRGGPFAPPRISERGEIPVIPEALLAHLSTESGFSRNFYSSVNKWETWLHIIHVIGGGSIHILWLLLPSPTKEKK